MFSSLQDSSSGSQSKSSITFKGQSSKINFKANNAVDAQTIQLYDIKTKKGTEFKIHSATQDYDVCRIRDVYFVNTHKEDISDEYKTEIGPWNLSPTNKIEEIIHENAPEKESVGIEGKKLSPNKTRERTQKNSPAKRSVTSAGKRFTCSKIEDYKETSVERPMSSACNKSQRISTISYKGDYWSNRLSSATKQVKQNLKQNSVHNKRCRDFFYLVNQAIKLQKVFTIGNQNKTAFPTIRDALNSRGWIEKSVEVPNEEDVLHLKMSEVTMRLLKESPVNFIWVMSYIDFGNIADDTIVSRFPKHNHFTTKVGLCSFLEDFHWFYEKDVSQTTSPKTFQIATGDDIENFIKEFGLTACVALLKIVVNQVTTAESDHFFKGGKVPITAVDFANAQCSEYILYRQHGDIDRVEDNKTLAKEWTDFLSWFYKVAHEKEHFQTTPYPMIQALYTMSKLTLKSIQPFWPLLDIEGCQNLWVIKPAAQFCGRGVKVMRNLENIVAHVEVTVDSKISRHIVQKYIEQPLLIYNTKFDIRQWFLITSVYPLVIWIYKECYLRFSSQPFSLEDLHESIHLTNNAIQRNYTNNCARHARLPEENMWHSSTLQEYLREIGEPDKWDNVILPGIKEGFVGAVLASQEELIDRQNSFELYGADFLLGADFTPLLLEINMGPSMGPSTKITADLCKRGLEDVIKVVLDRRRDPKADTGQFEILYKQEMGPKHHLCGLELMVSGSKITPKNKETVKKSIM